MVYYNSMNYTVSTEELRERFGDVTLEIIFQRGNTRSSCVRRVSEGTVVAYSRVVFQNPGVTALGKELHEQILSGKAIGETIQNSGVPHERTVSNPYSATINCGLSFLFDTKKNGCVSRVVTYKIQGVPYASITEFYNPEYTPVGQDLPAGDVHEELFVIDQLKPGFEEEYLRLAHGFLKKPMHVGIEDQDLFVKETRQTLGLLMQDTNTGLFVAANDTEFVGYIALNTHPALHVNGLECIVRELYVDDEHQRKGIGASLLSYVERYARKKGCARLSLATKWDDDKQRSFYEHAGFSRRCDFVVKKLI